MFENIKYETIVDVQKNGENIKEKVVFNVKKENFNPEKHSLRNYSSYYSGLYPEDGFAYIIHGYFKSDRKISIDLALTSTQVHALVVGELNSANCLNDSFFKKEIECLKEKWRSVYPLKYAYSCCIEELIKDTRDGDYYRLNYYLKSPVKDKEDMKIYVDIKDSSKFRLERKLELGIISDIQLDTIKNCPNLGRHLPNKVSIMFEVHLPLQRKTPYRLKMVGYPFKETEKSQYANFTKQEIEVTPESLGSGICSYINQMDHSKLGDNSYRLGLGEFNNIVKNTLKKEVNELVEKVEIFTNIYFDNTGNNSYTFAGAKDRFVVLPHFDMPSGTLEVSKSEEFRNIYWDFEMIVPNMGSEFNYSHSFMKLNVKVDGRCRSYRKNALGDKFKGYDSNEVGISESMTFYEFAKCFNKVGKEYWGIESRLMGIDCEKYDFNYTRYVLSNVGRARISKLAKELKEKMNLTFDKELVSEWWVDTPEENKLYYIHSMAKEFHCFKDKLVLHFNYKIKDKIGIGIQEFQGENMYNEAFDFLKNNTDLEIVKSK